MRRIPGSLAAALFAVVGLVAAPAPISAAATKSARRTASTTSRPGSRSRGGPRTRRLAFRRDDRREGILNAFLQTATVAAHVEVTQRGAPGILVATPAGNSGVGLWFRSTGPGAADLDLSAPPVEIERDGLRGVAFEVTGPAALTSRQVLLDSVRALRDENAGALDEREATVGRALDALADAPSTPDVRRLRRLLKQWSKPRVVADPARPGTLVLERASLAGPRYRLEITPRDGTRVRYRRGAIEIEGDGDGGTRFEVATSFGWPQLTPLGPVMERPSDGPRGQEQNLRFLAYREGFLAGSFGYLSTFARDSLIT